MHYVVLIFDIFVIITFQIFNELINVWDYPFSMCTKFSKKLIFFALWCALVRSISRYKKSHCQFGKFCVITRWMIPLCYICHSYSDSVTKLRMLVAVSFNKVVIPMALTRFFQSMQATMKGHIHNVFVQK